MARGDSFGNLRRGNRNASKFYSPSSVGSLINQTELRTGVTRLHPREGGEQGVIKLCADRAHWHAFSAYLSCYFWKQVEIMTDQMLIVFGVLIGAVGLFAWGRLRADIVAILVVLSLMLTRVLTPQESLAGFGDPVVILIAAIFIVLVQSG